MAQVLYVLAETGGDLDGGRIDSVIIPSWVHRLNGGLIVVTLLTAAAWLIWLALRRAPFDHTGQVFVSLSQVF